MILPGSRHGYFCLSKNGPSSQFLFISTKLSMTDSFPALSGWYALSVCWSGMFLYGYPGRFIRLGPGETGGLLSPSGEEPGVEIMGRTKGYPGFVSAFQQTAAMLRQVQYGEVCWRHLSQRMGYLVRTSRPWMGFLPVSCGAAAHGSGPHLRPKKWS